MKKISLLFVSASLLTGVTSCDDWFSLEPQSEMVAEDFWLDKNDVESAVAACYRSMIEGSFMDRLLIWGEARSENVIKGPNCDASSDLALILSADINAKNGYADWAPFYTTINLCNTVIKNAPSVREKDPNFTESELKAYLAEAKAVRAFCYFTLVRTFNSVPFIEEPYTDDSRSYYTPQSSAETILTTLLADLQTVEYDIRPMFDNNIIYSKGRVNQKALWCLMADMYLWLNDYGKCVEYCDKALTATTNPLALVPNTGVAKSHFSRLFNTGNSTEGIWELQFDNNNNNNTVRDKYGNYNGNIESQLNANKALETCFLSKNDERFLNSYWNYGGSQRVMKYVAYRQTDKTANLVLNIDVYYSGALFNWIVYRLPDLYLMKAEALAELGDAASLEEAVRMVSKTYDRANADFEAGSLVGNYTTQDAVRDLVFDERQREFLFEGKRYFDLVRRMRREGKERLTNLINKYLMSKYENEDATTVMSKLNDIDAIYMPIHERELRLNTELVQNRFYEVSSDITK